MQTKERVSGGFLPYGQVKPDWETINAYLILDDDAELAIDHCRG
jgi:hypothetical protein